uniref:FERM domain-containing protein n=2 Tax=Clastoptera arizonana TaxID=38151 RepID=A0A1B6CYN1_9HEMI
MRKVWMTMVPGRDRQADTICHYPQELPKYMLGYQKCSKSDAILLAALIYRATFGDSLLELQNNSKKVIANLVPPFLLKLQSIKEWKKVIIEAYNNNSALSSEDAKIEFLKFVFPWSTFGSAFFDVKQMTDQQRFPEDITLAINKNGVFILDSQTREPLTLYPYTELTNWSSGRSTFTLNIGSVKLLCYTKLGYKMDDLITSYTALISPPNNGL